MSNLKKLFDLLTPAERKHAGLLMVMIVVMAGLDMIGVASIMPFMSVLANPKLVETNDALNHAFRAAGTVGIVSTQEFLLALGVLVFVLLVISLAFKALTVYAQTRFTLMREYSIGKRLVEGYLHQPYSWFLNQHSADLGKTILSEVNLVIHQAAVPAMNLIAQGAVAIALMGLLILIDPALALMLGLVLGLAYGIMFKVTSGFLMRMGSEGVKANKARFVAVSEAFGAVKELKVYGLEDAHVKRFAIPAKHYAKNQAASQAVGLLPRFALEAVAFGGMLIVMLYVMTQSGSFASALPLVSIYAFAGYRLMPALQQVYYAVTQLRYAEPALKTLHKEIQSLPVNTSLKKDETCLDALALTRNIALKNISYSYPNTLRTVVRDLSLTIPAMSTIGFVGETGSGKTTIADLILGILHPKMGRIEVDGKIINEHNRRYWQRSIGYVPQQIYLADDTIAANIAFGCDASEINYEDVERAAKIANLHEFVSSELPDGYRTTIGERGVRLSGGQRQRIGIARALYHKPQLIILDEATSALDNLTEQVVMEAVHNLGREVTIILIAHRLSTVQDCDVIFLLERGVVTGHGKYSELIQKNERFRKMASIG